MPRRQFKLSYWCTPDDDNVHSHHGTDIVPIPELDTWRLLLSPGVYHSHLRPTVPILHHSRLRRPPQSGLVQSCPVASRPLLPCHTDPRPMVLHGTPSGATRPRASPLGATIADPTFPISHGNHRAKANMAGGGDTCDPRAPTSLPVQSLERAS